MANTYQMAIYSFVPSLLAPSEPRTYLVAGLPESMPFDPKQWKPITPILPVKMDLGGLVESLHQSSVPIIKPHPGQDRLYFGSLDDAVFVQFDPAYVPSVCVTVGLPLSSKILK